MVLVVFQSARWLFPALALLGYPHCTQLCAGAAQPQHLPPGVSQVSGDRPCHPLGFNPPLWREVGLALHKGAGYGMRVSSQQLLKLLNGLEAPQVTEIVRVLWAFEGERDPGVLLPLCSTTERIQALQGSLLYKIL